MKAFVILNKSAGSASSDRLVEDIREAFEADGFSVELRLMDGTSLEDLIDEALASDADVIVSGGGDGTLRAIAERLLGTGRALGILPFGTVNYLARYLGIPLEVGGAVGTITRGRLREIDAAEVNGELFTCNVMVGMFTYAMFAAERSRKRSRLDKLVRTWTLLRMSLRLFLMLPLEYFEIRAGDSVLRDRAAFIFVVNNRFSIEVLDPSKPDVPASGNLDVYVPRTAARGEILRLLWRALRNRLDTAEHLEVIEHEAVTVRMKRRTVMVALDGEFRPLDLPLRFRNLHKSLSVYVPAKESREVRTAPGERVKGNA